MTKQQFHNIISDFLSDREESHPFLLSTFNDDIWTYSIFSQKYNIGISFCHRLREQVSKISTVKLRIESKLFGIQTLNIYAEYINNGYAIHDEYNIVDDYTGITHYYNMINIDLLCQSTYYS